MESVIARDPDGESRLPYLLRVPLGDGLVFKAGGTWPRTRAIFCYPVERTDWPADAEVVERVPVRSCRRRGAAIDLVLDRSRENRSQIVYTTGRGRKMVFWQSPRTRKQARPQVRTPTARAGGPPDLRILADAHEKYPYRFADARVTVVRRALPCGDYAVEVGGRLVASVERKSLADLVSILTSGWLRFAPGELSALPRGRGGGGQVLWPVRPGLGAAGDGGRWSGRAAGAVPRGADHVLREPDADGTVDLPVPGRRPRVGGRRDRRGGQARCSHRNRRGHRPAGAGPGHRRGTGVGAGPGTGGTRPGPAATGDLAGVARGPSGNAMVVPAPG